MLKVLKKLLIIFLVIGAIVGGLFVARECWIRWRYPYGWSHCCDKQLMFGLRHYAEARDGVFPSGESSPEASLSLLYPHFADANLLRGKTVPLDVVESILERGERLGPETCGWHYVEGLRLDDNSRLGLCWDKAGLGHNGERLPKGGHIVIFVRGTIEYIPGSEWDKFLAEQKQLLEERDKKRGKAE